MADRPLILLDALLVQPEPTGVGRAILELTRALAARDRGCDFGVLATHPAAFAALEGVPGWRVWPCPGAVGGTLRKALYTQRSVPALAARLGAAVLHSLQFVAPLRLPCRSVVTVHDLAYRRFPGTVETPRRWYYQVLVPATLRRASRIVTNSQATADDVAALFPAVRDRLRVTPFGTPSWVWEQPTPPAGAGVGGAFLFVGTLEPRKNLPRLLEAYGRFRDRAEGAGGPPPPDLMLVGGRGWGDSPLRGPLRTLQARGALRLEGYCQPARLWELYGAARALLFPSLHEGFGFPILEAMAAGLPVLTSDRGAMREVAGDAALLVDPDDAEAIAGALVRLDRDAALRARLIARGRERARAWSWERTADATAAVYAELVAGGGPCDEIAVAPHEIRA
ncbi:MAG: glycosyltransferase family 4 protein [Candidatus Krumholzibacteriia bacterium]